MNIVEIAKLAGVSKSTVSRVLNGKDDVSKATKNKILEIIEKEHFVPNRYASNLSTAKSKLIGVMVPDIKNNFYVEIIDLVEIELKKNGYTMFLCNSRGDMALEGYYFDMLVSLRAEGLLFISPRFSIQGLDKLGTMPIVSIDGKINSSIPSVVCNHKKGIINSFDKIIEKDCKNILYITGIDDFYSVAAKNKGYQEVIEKIDSNINIVKMETGLDSNQNYLSIKQQITSHSEIDGIVCINDELAFLVIRIAREMNLFIPEDIMLIGYDDNPYIGKLALGLSSIKMPIDKLAKNSVRMMMSYLLTHDKVESMKFDIKLIERKSIAK